MMRRSNLKAISECRKALKNPYFIPARDTLSRIAYVHQDFATLLDILRPVIAAKRGDAQERLLWIHALGQLERGDALRAEVRTGMQGWGEGEKAFARGTLARLDRLDDQVESHLSKAVEAFPTSRRLCSPT